MVEYLVVRCHGLATHLLPNQVTEGLISSKNLKDFADMLGLTDYGQRIRELKKVDAHALERIFNEELVERYKRVIEAAPDNLKEFLRSYCRRLEVQALSRVLRGKFLKSPPQEIKRTLPPLNGLSEINLEKIAEAETVEEAVELLKLSPYEEVAGSLDWCRKYNTALPLEFHLKRIYYTIVLEALRNVPSEDRERIRNLLGIEIDAVNCFMALAPYLYGYSPELVNQLFIPYFFKLAPSKLQEAARAKSPRAIMKLLAEYKDLARALLEEGDEVLAESVALTLLKKEVKRQMLETSIALTYVVCFLILCEIERRNLVFLAFSLEQNLEPKNYVVI
ncbi:TPA: hypothetical protein EYP26_04105 [Candidatus Bathyarchaeota archaeon]|nr:hypothetical protein [Candidatus Bathyarchaeota archaeon]